MFPKKALHNVVITNFYKFIPIENKFDLQVRLLKFCREHDINGTILLAEEGINAALAAVRKAMDEFYAFITSFPSFIDLEFKESLSEHPPFQKLKVRLKKEIVAFHMPHLNMRERGEYLDAEKWDTFLKRKDIVLIDTRNDYEVQLGTFKTALDPKISKFSEFSRWADQNLADISKEKDILMFCTGGIRCEKTTAYLKQRGFKNVYHLKGGILKYLEHTKNKSHNWVGECFVFDDRLSINHQLDATFRI